MAAAQIYNMLMDYKGDVTVKIDGIAASAASVIAMAGTRVLVSPVSMMMIHNPMTMAMGDTAEMQKAIEMLGSVKDSIINAYEIKTGLSRAKLSHLMDALSSIVYCSKCGEIYRRIAWNNRGKHSTVWRCCTRVEHGPTACDAPTIQEPDLQAAVVQAINLALGNRENMMVTLQENVEAVIRQEDETSSEGIEAKLMELQKELLKLANSKKDYNSVADEIDRLRELKQNALLESAEREGLKQRIKEMREFLEQQSTEVTEYDELLVRRLIEKVTVYDERFEVKFKSGAEVDVER